jgi:hypothetical protein
VELEIDLPAFWAWHDHSAASRRAHGAAYAIFEVAEAATEIDSGLSEVHYLPSRSTPERETWYINMGVTTNDMFTLQAMVKAAH